MASNPDQSTAEEYLAKAKAAEEAAAKATDPILKKGTPESPVHIGNGGREAGR